MSEAVLDTPATEPARQETPIAARIALSETASATIRRKQRWSRFIKIVRRAHLYAGLFMTPWVFLYGITAFLFNHPSILSDQTVIPIEGQEASAVFAGLIPDASKIASDTVARINTVARAEYRLDPSVPPRFSRPLALAMTDGTSQFQLTFDFESRRGNVRVTPVRTAAPPTPAQSNAGLPARLSFEGFDPARAIREITPVLKNSGVAFGELKPAEPMPAGIPGGETDSAVRKSRNREGDAGAGNRGERGEPVRKPGGAGEAPAKGRGEPAPNGGQQSVPAVAGRGLPQGPEVEFVMLAPDGAKNDVRYNLRTGSLNVRHAGESDVTAASAGSPLSTRRYFLRLHTAHGYPERFGSRWIWAVIVDVMFVCMVGWAVTGIVMWHQMKHLRRIGWVVLSASVVASVIVAIGMHGEMVSAGR